jgi:predicted TIM-barrel fold metal-dependent hydrolase
MKVPYPGAIDCDLHLPMPNMSALMPYVDDFWREQFVTRRIDKMDFQLTSFPPNTPLAMRDDWRADADGEIALEKLRRQALDPFGTRIAICSILHGAIGLYNEDMAAVICSAVNDHMAREWLNHEPRLRGSILITSQNADLAAREIERLAGDKRFVQVLMPVLSDMLPGKRQMWPIYRACEKHGLAIALHAGSTYRFPPTGSGWPSYHVEDYVAQSTASENAIVSFLAEGVFSEFPDLRLICLESGFTWLPTMLWRLNKEWRGVRQEVPWLDRPPAEIVREHVRFSLHPIDAPHDGILLKRTFAHIAADDLVLFSTDYPHAHFDGHDVLPDGLPDDLIRKIMIDNPLAAYPRLAAERAAATTKETAA